MRAAKPARLDHVVSLRLPAALHDRFYAAAKATGTSVGGAIRRHLEEEPLVLVKNESGRTVDANELSRMADAAHRLKQVRKVKSSDEKRRLVYLFGKASNNLNQIAHCLNTAYVSGKSPVNSHDRAVSELMALGALLRGSLADVD